MNPVMYKKLKTALIG